ncbi:hypothetical protein SETIT_8G129000v2 [Setaria italica]|uniref:Uncharacterized protein n=1 Tax=Setaria italica TaxID=4555 RepID=A0A368S8T2_SETIT|nr:hypothetical protein SETIT_8G129000v2 [Setaria italica]
MECVTKDAKRKWEIFAEQAENDCKVGSSSSAAKQCRMETMLQECAFTVDSAVQQWKKSHAAVNDLSKKHFAEVEVLVRMAVENNEQHEVEIASSRAMAEEHASNSSKDITQDIDSSFLVTQSDNQKVIERNVVHASPATAQTNCCPQRIRFCFYPWRSTPRAIHPCQVPLFGESQIHGNL